MGKPFYDKYIWHHFISGIIAGIVIFPGHKKLSFFISNGAHLLMELSENGSHPNGEVLESNLNHLGDIIGFFFGWLLGAQISPKSRWIHWLGYLFIIIALSKELGREYFPYSRNWLFRGAYTEQTSTGVENLVTQVWNFFVM